MRVVERPSTFEAIKFDANDPTEAIRWVESHGDGATIELMYLSGVPSESNPPRVRLRIQSQSANDGRLLDRNEAPSEWYVGNGRWVIYRWPAGERYAVMADEEFTHYFTEYED